MYRRKREIAELQGNVVEANLEPVPRPSSPIQKEVATMTELDIDNVTFSNHQIYIHNNTTKIVSCRIPKNTSPKYQV